MLVEKRRWAETDYPQFVPVALQPSMAQKIPNTGDLISVQKV